jgi:hypothetical protein
MKRFKSRGQAQRFLSAHDQIANLFHFRRDAYRRRTSRCQDTGTQHLGGDQPRHRLGLTAMLPAPHTS